MATESLNLGEQLGQGMNVADSLIQSVQTIVDVAQTGKRREFEQSISLLDNRQQLQLQKELNQANTKEKKLQILAEAVKSIKEKQQESIVKTKLSAIELKRKQRERMTTIIVIGGSLAILLAIYLYKRTD